MTPEHTHHEWHIAEDMAILIDQDKHRVAGYVICATHGEVKPFTCEEALT